MKKHPLLRKIVVFLVICLAVFIIGQKHRSPQNDTEGYSLPDRTITHEYLSVNPYSRPQIPLRQVKGIVVHYTANPGSTPKNNKDYFESLKDNHKTHASAHFVIGTDGSIMQIIPLNEIAYASNQRNKDTISIECCHLDQSGKFTDATYQSLVKLVSGLCQTYHLSRDDVISHYDVTGKLCPLYYVRHRDAWFAFKRDIVV
ncbi:MAG TPA: N-acetylmuramoyl-L-alanine amidase [Erysipelotrichaceae bacterium]|nr:N-acetylmuramoyl-L-alanine amidase [Erysipelotrichaceae bacterium]